MLANSLKEMEADGLVVRTVFSDEMRVKVEYSLTDKAQSILPILLELKEWGENNLKRKHGLIYLKVCEAGKQAAISNEKVVVDQL